METTLFWIGCGLGGYAWVLRQIFKRDVLLNRRFFISALHILFMAVALGLLGFVVSASVDLHGPTPKWPIIGAILGLFWGLFQTTRTSPVTEGPPQLLAGDLEWVETAFSAVLLAAVIMYAVIQAFKIPSGSMEDTLHIGDHLFVNKFIYGIRVPFTDKRIFKLRDVRRGDIVVFECPPAALSQADREHNVHKDFIKRAVALAGDDVWVKDKRLYINGQLQNEPYAVYRDPVTFPAQPLLTHQVNYQKMWEEGELAHIKEGAWMRDNFGPVKVPPNSYFVMGDNRDGSFDARFWGPLPNRLLKGKAWIVYWPLTRIRVIR